MSTTLHQVTWDNVHALAVRFRGDLWGTPRDPRVAVRTARGWEHVPCGYWIAEAADGALTVHADPLPVVLAAHAVTDGGGER